MVENIMEEKEETMVSPFVSDPFLKTAYFLKPISKNPFPLSPLSKAQVFDARETPLNVYFRGITLPQDMWKDWVYKLLPKYQDIWKTAGIFYSILNSTYKIFRNNDLILSLAERWCVETNTFVFPWGESTITLEDMIVLGGYSVLGDSVSSPLSSTEMIKIKEKLVEAKRNIESGTGRFLSHLLWLKEFIDKNDELEHVAFLALWLARYVFSTGHGGVGTNVFPIAIHLSIGTRLAIAPVVLAILYRDLSLLKSSIISSSKGSSLKREGESNRPNIWAPIQLVQIWVWERFPTLRPIPDPIQVWEPRLARWHEKVQVKLDFRKVLDSDGEDFQWRPYCMVVNNWRFNEFYRTNGELVIVESGMDEEIESYALCIRPSELVGLGGFVEQYLPHRVAMQFGLDQDIPGFVPRFNDSLDSAWGYFKRPIEDKKLYIPPRLFEADVTFRYRAWWDSTVSAKEERMESNVEKAQSKTNNQASKKHKDNFQKNKKSNKDLKDCDPLDDLTIGELLRLANKTTVVGEGVVREDKCSMGNSSENSSLSVLKNGVSEDVETMADPMDASSSVSNQEYEFPSWYEPLRPGMLLEDRISRLERLVAKFKAEKFGRSVWESSNLKLG